MGGRRLELLELRPRLLEVGQALVEDLLLGGRLGPQLAGVEAGLADRLAEREERLLVLGDLLGEDLVLVADVDEVADVGDRVGERIGRQDRLEERRPVAVVGRPDVIGEERLALGELGRLRVLLGLDLRKLGVEIGELGDLRVVDRPDRVDLDRHALDLGLDVDQVGVDPVELGRGGLDDDPQVGLEPVELGDPGLLGLDLGRDRLLPGEGVRELVAGRDLGRPKGPAEERDEDGRDQPDPGRGPEAPPARRVRGHEGTGTLVRGGSDDHRGDVTLRANSVARARLDATGGYARRYAPSPGAHLGTTPAPGIIRLAVQNAPRSEGPGPAGSSVRCRAQVRRTIAHSAPRMRNGPNGTYVRRLTRRSTSRAKTTIPPTNTPATVPSRAR